MKLKLERPLCFFDLETTGLNVATERIVSIAIHKLMPDGEVVKKSRLINPERPIPLEVTEIHGITDDMVADAPTFRQIAKAMQEFLEDCDLGGYNMVNFDLPLLSEEFARCGILFPSLDAKRVDAGVIFHKQEPRTLEAAYKKFCGKELTDAHDADADTDATREVFMAQVEKYEDLGTTVEEIHEYCSDGRADLANKVKMVDGEFVYNFGKHKGAKVSDEPDFAYWMLEKDFPFNTKMVVKMALEMAGHTVTTSIAPK